MALGFSSHGFVISCSFTLSHLHAKPNRPGKLISCQKGPCKSRQASFPTHTDEPVLLRFAVSFATEFLRAFRKVDIESSVSDSNFFPESKECAVSVQQIMNALRYDYQHSYFLTGNFTRTLYAENCYFADPTIRFTGNFTRTLYAENCYFADPTIRFTGRDLYERNLKLLVPFFEEPSIDLLNIEEGVESGECFIKADWIMRTYLKLPWRPLILVDGSTIYILDGHMKIVKHVETWGIPTYQAIVQLFTPSS